MKRSGFLICAIIIIAGILFNDQSGLASGIFRKVTLPFKLAAIYFEHPDTKLALPVEGVHVKQIANTWHGPRSGGRQHEGQDIFAKRGTPVFSATDGYITRIGENSLGGHTVFVMGAGGRSYYYAHLDSYAQDISVGDWVTSDRVLGYVGTTGNAQGTPPHLHFGVYTSTGAINPLPLLKDRN
jgi:murein DD-endopeptidase MepM/ murein hydrolase activator NlpD